MRDKQQCFVGFAKFSTKSMLVSALQHRRRRCRNRWAAALDVERFFEILALDRAGDA